MLNVLNSIYMIFALLAQTEDPGNQSTKKLILSLAVAFLVFGIIYLFWQTFYNIPPE